MNASVPHKISNWLASIPQDNCGKFYATIKTPYLPIYIEYLVPWWGQVCNGQPNIDVVHTALLYNSFPLHGKGFTYVSWRAVPDNPELCKTKLFGKIENPRPYDGGN